MNYKEALKKVQSGKKSKEGYLVITFSYSDKYVFPYKEGIAVLTALEQAEQWEDSYTASIPKLNALTTDTFTVQIMSEEQYQEIKVAQLLGISVSELRESKKKEVATV